MIIVLAHAFIRPEAFEHVAAAARVQAHSSRIEPGCLQYEVLQTLDQPTRIATTERYRSREDFEAHMAAPHTQAFLAVVGAAVTAAPVIESFEVSEP